MNNVSRVKTYIIKDDKSNLVKIGKAVNPLSRLKQLQCGSASKLEIFHIFDADIELVLHIKFKDKRSHGEWFSVDPIDVIEHAKSIDFAEFQQTKDEFIENRNNISKNLEKAFFSSAAPFNSFHFDYLVLINTCHEYELDLFIEIGMIIEIVSGMDVDCYMHDCKLDLVESRNLSPSINNDAFSELQRANTVYIEDGLDFQERKKKLTDLFNRKHKQTLIDEIHLLEA